MSMDGDGAIRGDVGKVELKGVTKRFGSMVAVDGIDLAGRGRRIPVAARARPVAARPPPCECWPVSSSPTPARSRISGESVQGIPPYKRDVNTVFQSYALFPHMDVAENVAYGLRQRKVPEVRDRRPGPPKRSTWSR